MSVMVRCALPRHWQADTRCDRKKSRDYCLWYLYLCSSQPLCPWWLVCIAKALGTCQGDTSVTGRNHEITALDFSIYVAYLSMSVMVRCALPRHWQGDTRCDRKKSRDYRHWYLYLRSLPLCPWWLGVHCQGITGQVVQDVRPMISLFT